MPYTSGTATSGGPSERTTLIVVPRGTCVAALVPWLTTEPLATVVLYCGCADVSSRRWFLVAAACACASVIDTKFGTVDGATPLLMTSRTAVFGATEVPATGSLVMTRPAVMVSEYCWVCVPTARCTACNADVAASTDSLESFGTAYRSGPLDRNNVT